MKTNKILLGCIWVMLSLVFVSSCSNDDDEEEIIIPTPPPIEEPEPIDTTFTNSVLIAFSDNGVEIINPFEEYIDVEVDNSHVTVKSSMPEDTEVNYVISGKTSNGSLKIYSNYRFELTMNSVQITSTYGPAINIQSGKRVNINLLEGTRNYLIDGEQYPTDSSEDMKAAFFSEGQLIFDGLGSLTVYGRNRHGICSDDYIRIKNGKIQVEFSVKDAIHVNDYFRMDGGELIITQAISNGIECERGYIEINDGSIDISCGNDAIIASYRGEDNTITPYVELNGGDIKINIESRNANGIESRGDLVITGGNIEINVKEDGIKSAGYMNIRGGSIYATSSLNDGIDSKGPLTISRGLIIACGSPDSESGIDCDDTLLITGGTVIGIGGAKTDPEITNEAQYSILYTGACSENQLLNISSGEGENLVTYKTGKAYSRLRFLFSSPELEGNKQYSLNTGGNVSEFESEFYGFYFNPVYSPENTITTFITDSKLTKIQ